MPAKKANEGEPKRAVFYIRFSSWHQDAENSKEGQFNALKAYADANGCVVVGTYIDEGISGRRDDRAELNRLMRDARCRNRPFDEVHVWKFDRLGRRASTIDRRATELESLGIALIAIKQPIEGKPAVVRFVRNLLGNIAEFISDNMGEDIARGKQTSASHGVWTNSSDPFGFNREYRQDRNRMRPLPSARSGDGTHHQTVGRIVPRRHRRQESRHAIPGRERTRTQQQPLDSFKGHQHAQKHRIRWIHTCWKALKIRRRRTAGTRPRHGDHNPGGIQPGPGNYGFP